MLSLGFPRTDARFVRAVRRRARWGHHLWKRPRLYEPFLRRQLRWLLGSVIAGCGFYDPDPCREVLCSPDPLERFPSIPLLSKAQLRSMAAAIAERDRRRVRFDACTSGTTGTPMRMVFGVEHFVSYFGRFRCLLERHALQPDPGSTSMVTVSVFPHIQDYYLLQTAAYNTFYHTININPRYWKSPADAVACVAREDPVIIRGMPSSLEVLLGYIERYPPPMPIRPSLVIVYAETLLPAIRQRLQVAFGAPVIDEYGLTEVGAMVAQECAMQEGFHVLPVDYYVEVVDPLRCPRSRRHRGARRRHQPVQQAGSHPALLHRRLRGARRTNRAGVGHRSRGCCG